MNMKLEISKDLADVNFIHDHLYAFNCAKSGTSVDPSVHPDQTLDYTVVKVTDDSGKCLGGAVCSPRENYCYMHFLWLDDSLRGGGWGTKVMQKVIETARKGHFPEVKLFTHCYQAPGFYPKLGFLLEKVTGGKGNEDYYYRLPLTDGKRAC